MKKLLILTGLIVLLAVASTGCASLADVAQDIDSAEDSLDATADVREEELDATADAADAIGDAPTEVCAALDPLEASLDVLEDMDPGEHSVEEFQAQFEVVHQDFQNLRAADTSGIYTADFDRFEAALAEFEDGLTSLLSGEGGLLSGFFGLASGAADLAVAGEILDEAIDCPGDRLKGGTVRDSTEPGSPELCAAVFELSVSLDGIEEIDPSTNPKLYWEAYDDVLKEWLVVVDLGSDLYPDAFGDFGQASGLYVTQLALYRSDPSISNLAKLGIAAGHLFIAEERLGFAIDCPDDPLGVEDSTEPASPELCEDVGELSVSLDLLEEIDPNTEPDLYQEVYDDVQKEWQAVVDIGKEQYPNAFTRFELAKVSYELKLAEFQADPSPSNLVRLVFATGQLVIAEERLGFAIDCPGV